MSEYDELVPEPDAPETPLPAESAAKAAEAMEGLAAVTIELPSWEELPPPLKEPVSPVWSDEELLRHPLVEAWGLERFKRSAYFKLWETEAARAQRGSSRGFAFPDLKPSEQKKRK